MLRPALWHPNTVPEGSHCTDAARSGAERWMLPSASSALPCPVSEPATRSVPSAHALSKGRHSSRVLPRHVSLRCEPLYASSTCSPCQHSGPTATAQSSDSSTQGVNPSEELSSIARAAWKQMHLQHSALQPSTGEARCQLSQWRRGAPQGPRPTTRPRLCRSNDSQMCPDLRTAAL